MSSVPDQGEVDPSERTFEGYRRDDGTVGVRNNVLVMPSVICSHIVADRIADSAESAVSVPHDHGCAQIGSDHEQTERTMVNLSQNPNIAGTTVVGLGCEHLQSGELAARIAEQDRPVRETAIQDAGGSDACIEEGTDAVAELQARPRPLTGPELRWPTSPSASSSSDVEDSTRTVADPSSATWSRPCWRRAAASSSPGRSDWRPTRRPSVTAPRTRRPPTRSERSPIGVLASRATCGTSSTGLPTSRLSRSPPPGAMPPPRRSSRTVSGRRHRGG
ncbi:UxaA family hydrolase [Halomicroarcula sp. GCM10025710]